MNCTICPMRHECDGEDCPFASFRTKEETK